MSTATPPRIAALGRFVTVLTRPATTLRAVAESGAPSPLTFFMVYAAVQLVRVFPAAYRDAPLFGENPRIVSRRVGRLLWTECNADITFLIGAGVVSFFVLLAWRKKSGEAPLRPSQIAAVVATAGAPILVLKAAATIAAIFGANAWWMPHHPVNAAYALWDGEAFSAVRFGAKAALTYGPSVILLLWFAARGGSAGSTPEGARAPAPGWAIVVIAVLAGFALLMLSRPLWGEMNRAVGPGDPLPDEVLEAFDPEGTRGAPESIDLAALRGQVVVLDFWASWCAPCKREMPELSRLADKFRDRGLVVLGVNREPRSQAGARRVWDELRPTFQSAVDRYAFSRRGLGERLGVESLPTTYIIDPGGVVRHVHIGYTPPRRFEAEVSALLPSR